MQRMEEVTSKEPQQGWSRYKEKSRTEIEKEGEVQEFLDRPRIMEEGRTPVRKSTSYRVGRGSFSGEQGETEDDINVRLAKRFGSIRR